MSKDQAIAPAPIDDKQVDRISKSYCRRYDFARAIIAARDAQWKAQQPAQPDCRTCVKRGTTGDCIAWAPGLKESLRCTNGDKYEAAPRVVLWRTE